MKRLFAAVMVVLGGVFAVQALAVSQVSAHAELVSASPVNGAMLADPPNLVELVFSENVGKPAALAVLGSDGDEVDGGELQIVNDTMQRAYDPSSFAPGVYTVSYQVTSADGHPVSGTLSFMVHGDGSSSSASSAAALPSVPSNDSTDADPTLVLVLVVVVALGLAVALLVTWRLLAQPEVEPAS
jgi:methionine-rich copper-binding protein CopC